jgi:hypothetical protein
MRRVRNTGIALNFKHLAGWIGGYQASGWIMDCPSVGFKVATALAIRVAYSG